ncbi:alpha/beta hydrolase [Archangium gephyra]|uniref:alpha/beta hydrolase n=1 Tax=Archangium gephyra TaxID=48 RepID=UPI003B7D2F47
MSRRLLATGLLSAMVGVGACYDLDPFLYSRTRVEHYTLPAEGSTPEETVAPEQIEPVELVVDGQVRLGAAYVKATQQPPRAYVLYFHGICCNLNQHIARPKGLANLGYDVLVFDYRGWGTSSDLEPTEPGLLEDSRAALAWLSARAGVPAERIVYYGRSFGSAVASQLAAHVPPAALVLESPFSSVQGLVRDSSNMDLPGSFFAEGSWDTEGRVRSLQGVPLLLLHGTADDFIRPEFSERLYAVAREPRQLVLVEGADHDDVPQRMGVDYARTLGAFLEVARTRP